MTFYYLSPNGSDMQAFFAGEIERYIKGGEDLTTHPVLISIDTVVRVYAPNFAKGYIFMPAVDFTQYMSGTSPKADFTKKDWNEGLSPSEYPVNTWLDIITSSLKKSIKDLPSRYRKTNLQGDAALNDAFWYGQALAYGGVLRSVDGVASYKDNSVTGIMESLKFKSGMLGFVIAANSEVVPELQQPSGRFDIRTNQPQDVVLDSSAVKIGQNVTVSLDLTQNSQDLAIWKKALDSGPVSGGGMIGAGYPKIKINLKRTAPSVATADKTSDFATDAPYKGDGQPVPITVEELQPLLEGKEWIDYIDNTSLVAIEEDQKIEYAYTAEVEIQLSDTLFIPLTADDGNAGKSFYRPVIPPEVRGYYTSQPSYWSEIKEGSPGNETFEAMAGTPTTRSLYFATGGSEFIVDVEVEYVPDMTSTRTYRSYFSGVPSEFKEGDQAKAYTVPSPSGAGSSSLTVNAHQGGTVRATWTGVLPYAGAVTWGDHWVNVNNKWDYSAYNTAKSQAQAWAGAVNGFTISYKAASDGITRKFNGWGAHITTDSKVEPKGYANPGQKEIPCTPVEGGGCVGGQSYVASSGQNGADGTFTITVEGAIPARIIDGPSSIYDLPAIEDTWTQSVTYDYTKINKAKVWKIEQSKVNGMIALTGTNEITASIAQGNPTLFYNIADESKLSTEASKEGRLRYALETDQHDVVVWNEGPRSNKDDGRGDNGWIKGPGQSANWAHGIIYTNPGYGDTPDYHAAHATAKDKLTPEYRTFDQRRKTKKEVTAISDFLILQTSSGDQSVMYFEKTSAPVEAQRQVDIPKTTKEAQWEDNPLSAADWSPDQIHIGSYNGQYYSPATKYSAFRSGPIATVFDRLPGGMVRPARPTSALRLMQTGIGVIHTIPNGEYVTGDSSVFYKLILDRGDGGTIYPTGHNAKYNERGAEFATAYSDLHSKVNNIVIHDPVSTEFAMIEPLANREDQRTPSTQALGGSLQKDQVVTETRLKADHPAQNYLYNGDAEKGTSGNQPVGWMNGQRGGASNAYVFTRRNNDAAWTMSGTSSFEIRGINEPAGSSGSYYQDLTGLPTGTSYTLSGMLSAHRSTGTVELSFFNGSGTLIKQLVADQVSNVSTPHHFSTSFVSPAGTARIRVELRKSATTSGTTNSYLFADDLRLVGDKVGGKALDFIPMAYKTYEEETVENPDYVAPPTPVPASTTTFEYTGDVQTFTAPVTGTYVLEAWGAQGGGFPSSPSVGGLGGYAKSVVALIKDQAYYVYVGGRGGHSPSDHIDGSTSANSNGGWNGGGNGAGTRGPGGGGRSDVRTDENDTQSVLVVAAGGGGGGSSGSYDSSASQPSSAYFHGINGCSGWYSSSWEYDTGGGGGGYHGGNSICGDDPSTGYAGDNYSTGSGSTGSYGVKEGNGQVKITSPGYTPEVAGMRQEFAYTGAAQTFTAPADGVYTLELWGAQGGDITSYYPIEGGKGGYSSGNVTLAKGDKLHIYVGGKGADRQGNHPYSNEYVPGGWNGGGATQTYGTGTPGGGATDIRKGGTVLANRIIVAGGGGGGGWTYAKGGAGGGTTGIDGTSMNGFGTGARGGSQTAGGAKGSANASNPVTSGSFGQGGTGSGYSAGGGGGGGGYYGGGGGGYSDGGGGGSGYVGGVASGLTVAGNQTMPNPAGGSMKGRSGGGFAVITSPAPPPEPPYVTIKSEGTIQVSEPPDDWYETVNVTISAAAPVTLPDGHDYVPGNFVNLDRDFTVYFPNRGNFYGDGAYGVGSTRPLPGKGYSDGMDTTEWTASKTVKFDFNVEYNGVIYTAGEEISLPVHQTEYHFHVPLANYEAVSAKVRFKVIAINGSYLDNPLQNNRYRYANHAARHSGVKDWNVDVVGRIGNLILEDSGDFRFSNLFKQAKPEGWYIPNVVPSVDPHRQRSIVGSSVDILNHPVGPDTHYLNTYGLLPFADRDPIELPLTPEKNNIPALTRQPMRLGYNVMQDIQTIGNYASGGLQVIPFYYSLNLLTGEIKSVDVYMNVNGSYVPVNKNGIVGKGWDSSQVYYNEVALNWEKEKERRNYTTGEEKVTESVVSAYQTLNPEGDWENLIKPAGTYYPYGSSQLLQLTSRNRTFMGTSHTYEVDRNPGSVLPESFYNLQGQRWHFSVGLPSSSVAVESGKPVAQANMNEIMNNHTVILMALDIKAIGDTYVLQYDSPNTTVTVGGKTWDLDSIAHPVVNVFSSNKSSADDLSVSGTH